jgi:hypothetical protein
MQDHRKLGFQEFSWLEEREVLGDVVDVESGEPAKYGLLLTEGENPRIWIHWTNGNYPRNQWFVMPVHANFALLHGVILLKFPDKYQRARDFLFPPQQSKAAAA